MLMKIDRKNKLVCIMPPCPDTSPADLARFKEMLAFIKGKFKEFGYKVKEGAF